MPFPIIPILAVAAIVGGFSTLSWYSSLSQEEQDYADRRANELAAELFGRAFESLSRAQMEQVLAQVEYEEQEYEI